MQILKMDLFTIKIFNIDIHKHVPVNTLKKVIHKSFLTIFLSFKFVHILNKSSIFLIFWVKDINLNSLILNKNELFLLIWVY